MAWPASPLAARGRRPVQVRHEHRGPVIADRSAQPRTPRHPSRAGPSHALPQRALARVGRRLERRSRSGPASSRPRRHRRRAPGRVRRSQAVPALRPRRALRAGAARPRDRRRARSPTRQTSRSSSTTTREPRCASAACPATGSLAMIPSIDATFHSRREARPAEPVLGYVEGWRRARARSSPAIVRSLADRGVSLECVETRLDRQTHSGWPRSSRVSRCGSAVSSRRSTSPRGCEAGERSSCRRTPRACRWPPSRRSAPSCPFLAVCAACSSTSSRNMTALVDSRDTLNNRPGPPSRPARRPRPAGSPTTSRGVARGTRSTTPCLRGDPGPGRPRGRCSVGYAASAGRRAFLFEATPASIGWRRDVRALVQQRDAGRLWPGWAAPSVLPDPQPGGRGPRRDRGVARGRPG